jgi:hypothetical protein
MFDACLAPFASGRTAGIARIDAESGLPIPVSQEDAVDNPGF